MLQVKIIRFILLCQTWGALHKAWKGYVIAKNKYEHDKIEYYASVIQNLQNELGLRVSSFHDIGMSALKFYSSRYSEYLNKTRRTIADFLSFALMFELALGGMTLL